MKIEDIKNKIDNCKDGGLENIKENISEKKGKIKKFVMLTIAGVTILGVVGAGSAFAYMKSNINYSEAQLKNVALKKIPGEVVSIKKDIDEDSLSLVYEFKIKDKNNMLNEIELDSKTGAIIDIENNYYNSEHNNKENDDFYDNINSNREESKTTNK